MTFNNNKKFKVDELIEILNKLKENKKTNVSFETCNYDDEWLSLNIKQIEFEEGLNDIVIVFEESKEYDKNIF